MKKRDSRFLVPERAKAFSPNRQTIEKALVWLREEKEELAGHITDVNLAVQLYLKDQERKRDKASFLQGFSLYRDSLYKNEQTKTTQFPIEMGQFGPTRFENSGSDKREAPKKLTPDQLKSKTSFLLDEKSQEAVKRAGSQLNIPAEAALKALIQLGCRTLQTLLK